MALIVITIHDGQDGVDVAVQGEPALPQDPNALLTGAQVVALDMLRAASGEHPIKQDRGLIQLIN